MKNDPAFPLTSGVHEGLTKLEWYSGLAMQGFSANSECWEEKDLAETAELSIKQAKELIKQLEAEK